MKKLLIITLFIFCATTAHGAWETTGNIVTATDKIGSTNGQDVSFVRGNVEKLRLTTDGLRFMSPLAWISDSNGQVFLNHYTGGGTALYGFLGTRMVNLTANGVEITGNLIAKTNYVYVTDGGTYTLTATDHTIEISGGEVITPASTQSNKGKHYEIINTSTGTIPVHTDNGQLIGNLNPEAEYQLPAGCAVTLVSSGAGWRIVSKY